VGADAELAQVTRPGVGLEPRVEQLLATPRARFHDPTALEAQRDALDDRAGHARRDLERDPALRGGLDGPREHLAGMRAALAVGVDPLAARHVQAQVRAGTGDAHLARLREAVRPALLRRAEFPPPRGRIGVVKEHGAEDE